MQIALEHVYLTVTDLDRTLGDHTKSGQSSTLESRPLEPFGDWGPYRGVDLSSMDQ
jgi:hypothetical protein